MTTQKSVAAPSTKEAPFLVTPQVIEKRGAFVWRQLLEPTSWPAIASFVGPLLLYTFTMAPTVTLEDSGEFITAAYNLGIPHPPGYPLWCMLAHLFTWIPVGNIPERVHFFSAVCGAGTCLVTYFIGQRLTHDRFAALFGAWTLAVSRYLWSQSVIAEVYALNALLIAISLWAILEWKATKKPGWIYLLSLVVGLGAANHYLVLLFTPIYIAWLFTSDWEKLLLPRLIQFSLLFLAIGLSLYLYLPIRAAADPVPNLMGKGTLENVVDHILRRAYSTENETVRQGGNLNDGIQHSVTAIRRHLEAFTPYAVPIVCLGLIYLVRRNPGYLFASLALWLFNDVLTNVLLQERFNPSWDFVHRVYYIPADIVWGTWIAAGLAMIFQFVSGFPLKVLRLAAVAGVIGIAFTNLPYGNRRNEWIADRVARDILRSMPPNSRMLPNDDLIYPILYLTKVEGYRPDVQIVGGHFGHQERKESGELYSFSPVTLAWKVFLKPIANCGTVAEGLVYRVTPSKVNYVDHARFKSLDPPPADLPTTFDPDDTMDRYARSLLGCYYARLGAKEFSRGNKEAANKAWDKAEIYAQNAYSKFELARIYRELKVRNDRVEPLLRESLSLYEHFYDPATERLCPVNSVLILDALKQFQSGTRVKDTRIP